MKYVLILICMSMVSIVMGCASDVQTQPMQTIVFSNYRMNISTGYVLGNKDNMIDNRIEKKVISIYHENMSSLNFSDNIIISQDKLTPRASLEDYVQASIGGISYTRGQYASLSFDVSTTLCHGKKIPAIMNTFSIYRTPTNSAPETLYFAQYFIQNNDEVIIVSANTNQKDILTSLITMLKTLSCA